MKKVCSRCGNIILHKQGCECTPKYNRKVKDHPYCERCWKKYKILTTEYLQGHPHKVI